jgi:hypothetical protein
MTASEIVDRVLQERQETSSIDIKASLSEIKANPTEIQKDIVSIANSSLDSEGWLIFGISNDYTVVGTVDLRTTTPLNQSEKDSCKQRFSQIAAAAKPTAILYDWNVVDREGKEIVAIRIKGRQKGQFYQTENGQSPYRVGDHTYFADLNKIREWLCEPQEEKPVNRALAVSVIQIAIYLTAYSWFSVWMLNQSFMWVIGFLVIVSIVIAVIQTGRPISETRLVNWCRRAFPIFVVVSILCVLGATVSSYAIGWYPRLNTLTFSTYISDAPVVSLYLLLATVIGGLILDLPYLSSEELRRLYEWSKRHRPFLAKGLALVLVTVIICACVVPADSNLVLFAPKVVLVETRYLTDGQYHIHQSGTLTEFGAWSQNARIVHLRIPLFPLIATGTYSFESNSTTKTAVIADYVGLDTPTLVEDPEGGILVQLTTIAAADSTAQFTVQFYSDYNVNSLAYVHLLDHPIFIRSFNNSIQQLEQKFVIVNYSPYDLALDPSDPITLYAGGSVPWPANLTFKYSPTPTSYPWPEYSYNNYTQSFLVYGGIQPHGNLTVSVVYNSA